MTGKRGLVTPIPSAGSRLLPARGKGFSGEVGGVDPLGGVGGLVDGDDCAEDAFGEVDVHHGLAVFEDAVYEVGGRAVEALQPVHGQLE